jgi:hypothetical protein
MYHREDLDAAITVVEAEIAEEWQERQPSMRRIKVLNAELEHLRHERDMAYPY